MDILGVEDFLGVGVDEEGGFRVDVEAFRLRGFLGDRRLFGLGGFFRFGLGAAGGGQGGGGEGEGTP